MTSPSYTVTKLGVCCAILVTAAFACRVDADEYFKSYAVSGRADVHVHADNGSVNFITADGSKVEFDVKYEKSEWGGGSGDGPQIDSRQDGNVVELTAVTPEHTWLGHGSRRLGIEVHMPKDADLRLETSNGSVAVSSLNGHITIRTTNGAVRAALLAGTIDISSTNGGIILDALQGSVKVQTSNGGIRATALDGKCELATSNGGIHVTGRFEWLDITSGNGAVVARAESGSTMSSAWSIRTTNAGVSLALPTGFKANLDASTSNGRITLDLPAELQGTRSESQAHGPVNGGGPSLVIHTSNGSIHIAAT